jgi:mono/diheme cytochrome c family protein
VKKSQRMSRSAVIGLAAITTFAFHAAASAADEAVEASGKARFNQYCAVCHGAGAKGDGPFASLLTSKPADLTMLAKANNGEFPFGRVYDTIDGRNMLKAHGTTDMPIWGQEMKDDGIGGETELRGRLVETVMYLRTIQQ